MIESIMGIKDRIIERMEHDISERGAERMDTTEMGKLADMVKDLAKAEYYCAVTESMGASGYQGYQGYQGQGNQGYQGSQGYQGRRRGYGMGYDIEAIRQAMQTATPEERERMRSELRSVV